jgi:uncharacterized protein YqcC (DUF446 family)
MSDRFMEIASLLIDIEQELRVMGLWETEMPSTEALSSNEPFAIDTLGFTQWLQFIFIPKMAVLIEQQSLPANCWIAPMAEEVFAQSNYASGLIAHLRRIDQLLSN